MWAGYWACRVVLTDVLHHRFSELKLIAKALLGEDPFDQVFSIAMAILTAQVWLIAWPYLKGALMGLIAKSAESWSEGIARRLSPKTAKIFAQRLPTAELREILKQREQAETEEAATPE